MKEVKTEGEKPSLSPNGGEGRGNGRREVVSTPERRSGKWKRKERSRLYARTAVKEVKTVGEKRSLSPNGGEGRGNGRREVVSTPERRSGKWKRKERSRL
ncbi:hypothetical protein AAV98_17540 [Bacillus sp. CHD6a]|nr:hypothetical protein AAV98_17540 [Bacillus sp. CHD6a]